VELNRRAVSFSKGVTHDLVATVRSEMTPPVTRAMAVSS
jgi:hypothetical protein